MANKKRRKWIILYVLFFIAYLFIASTPIKKELCLSPLWTLSTQKPPTPSEPAAASEILYPFLSLDSFGYFSPDGNIVLAQDRDDSLRLSPNFWSKDDAVTGRSEFFNPLGDRLFVSSEPGESFFDDNRIFILSPNQNSVSAFNKSGELLWRRDFPAPITALDAASGLFLAGLLNGAIELIDSSGKALFKFTPGGSRVGVIYAARLCSGGSGIALVSGIDPQRFLYLEGEGEAYKVVHHEYLPGELRRPVKTAVPASGSVVVYERTDGLGFFKVSDRKTNTAQLAGGVLIEIEESSSDDSLFALIERTGKRFLIGLRYDSTLSMEAAHDEAISILTRSNNQLFLSGSNAVMAFELLER